MRILVPGSDLGFLKNLSHGFEFENGHSYEVSYFIEGFRCSAYDEGFPKPVDFYFTEELIEAGKIRFFERNDSNTVQITLTTRFDMGAK